MFLNWRTLHARYLRSRWDLLNVFLKPQPIIFSISSEQGHATRQKAFLRFPSIDQIRDRPVELHENHFFRANVKKVYRLNDNVFEQQTFIV